MNKLPNISNLSEWYNDVVPAAELACHGPVRGTMVIRPYGCALWENIQKVLDQKIKETGHQNAIFPLFIPESYLHKEAEHVEGFSPELAVVTHAGGKKLEEPLVVRPTSETIIYAMFAQWIKSWRDLPLKVNQWANVVRWEMRPRLFLRTTEFFWQEGHTAHALEEEADQEAHLMIQEYADILQNYLAIPVFMGRKSESEKFAGADYTLTCEAIMPDGKALQMCTSHRLKQQFGAAFGIQYQDAQGNIAHPYYTSWGFTTRSIGAMVMTHGDDQGLIMPPKVAPWQIVIIPIFKQENKEQVLAEASKIYASLKNNFRVYLDLKNDRPGAKFYEWELKGVPVRIELGARDLVNQECTVYRRIDGQKIAIKLTELANKLDEMLLEIQQKMFARAQDRTQGLVIEGQKMVDLEAGISKGLALKSSWCGEALCEKELKKHQASIRCILPDKNLNNSCFNCQNDAKHHVLIARSY